jgi:hypothetical protein
MSAEKPWEDFTDPTASPYPVIPTGGTHGTMSEPRVGYGEDIAKGVAGGLGRGVTGLAGIQGTAGSLFRAGLAKAGVPEEYLTKGAAIAKYVPGIRALTTPSGAELQKTVEGYTGEFYQPKTLPGQYASTIAEFAPGMVIPGGSLAARAANTLTGAVGSETAGQLTKGSAFEPYARFVGGVAGGAAGAKAITPAAPASPARQAAIGVLERENIPVTAGQRTGSKPLQWLESNAADMPFSAGRAAEMQGAQAGAVDRAFTAKAFDPAELRARGLPPDAALPRANVMATGRQTLSDRYNQMSAAHQLRADPTLVQDLHRATTNYERLALPSQRATGSRDVASIRDDIVNQLIAGQGRMPGDAYQAARSRMGTLSESVKNSDPILANTLRDIRGGLDRAMQRSVPPDVAARWADTNRRWGNMKQIEGAVASAGENLSPARVAQSVRAGRQGQAAQGAGDMDELARAASLVIKPPPNSGTAARLGMQKLFNIPALLSGGGGAGIGAALGGPLGAAAGAVAPFVVNRLALSRPGQAYLGNQALPQNARDVLAQALAQQAAAQPSVMARSEAETSDYERKRREKLRELGLE